MSSDWSPVNACHGHPAAHSGKRTKNTHRKRSCQWLRAALTTSLVKSWADSSLILLNTFVPMCRPGQRTEAANVYMR